MKRRGEAILRAVAKRRRVIAGLGALSAAIVLVTTGGSDLWMGIFLTTAVFLLLFRRPRLAAVTITAIANMMIAGHNFEEIGRPFDEEWQRWWAASIVTAIFLVVYVGLVWLQRKRKV